MRLLELFSGTGSIGRAFEALGWEVTSLDLEGEPTIKCDILDWDHTAFPPKHFQVVWASPVCCEFFKALTRRPRRLEEGDRLGRWSSSTTSSPASGRWRTRRAGCSRRGPTWKASPSRT